jgi:hypothetical protein
MWEDNIRIEELDSDDTDTQGVGLAATGQRRFASDPLKFTGIDMSSSSRTRRSYGFEGDDSSSESKSESFDSEEGSSALQIQLRDKEEALVQSALARIRRAQAKGKSEVKLNQEELDALERRRKRLQAEARKEKKNSGSGTEKKRRSDKNLVTVPIASLDPSSRKKSAKHKRSGDLQMPTPGTSNPPGMLIPGPDGMMYAPIGYSLSGGSNRNSPTRPRSASSQQVLSHPPPFYPAGPHRNLSEGMRPTSSSSTSSRRPLPDDAEWIPGSSRRSSVSSQNFSVDPFEYQTSYGRPPAIPEQYLPGRRNVSNPSEVVYSSIRRSLPGGGGHPAAARAPASDSALRHRSSYADESSTEDESDDLGNGVQVFVDERETERERERERAVSRKPVGGTGRKKGKGR